MSAELSLQHRDLVAQDEDLGVLVPITHRQPPKEREPVRDTEVRQSKQHDGPSGESRRAMSAPVHCDDYHIEVSSRGGAGPWQ
jgi:hypothetical protein